MRSSRQFSLLNGANKLVRMYGRIFTSLVGPPYFYCSLVAFFAFCDFLCFLCFFYALLHAQKYSQAKIN